MRLKNSTCTSCGDSHLCPIEAREPANSTTYLDQVRRFLAQRTQPADPKLPATWVTATQLHRAYTTWQVTGSESPTGSDLFPGTAIGIRRFGNTVEACGHTRYKYGTTRWQGLQLTGSDAETPTDATASRQ